MAKGYLRRPNDFQSGTRYLTPEERGIYNDIIDLYIMYDGLLMDDDKQRAYDCAVTVRVWRRIKDCLVKHGKISIQNSIICPTNGETTLKLSLNSSETSRKAAETRWANYRAKSLYIKENPDAGADAGAMPVKLSKVNKEGKKEKPPLVPPRGSRPTIIPDDFSPNPKAYEIGAEEGYSTNEITWLSSGFRDHSAATGKKYKDHDKAFYNWLRSGIAKQDVARKRNANGQSSNGGADSVIAAARRIADRIKDEDSLF
jgi:hypothetical protein